jgi:hypothetical protein
LESHTVRLDVIGKEIIRDLRCEAVGMLADAKLADEAWKFMEAFHKAGCVSDRPIDLTRLLAKLRGEDRFKLIFRSRINVESKTLRILVP